MYDDNNNGLPPFGYYFWLVIRSLLTIGAFYLVLRFLAVFFFMKWLLW